MILEFSFGITSDKVIERLINVRNNILPAVADKMTYLMLKLQQKIVGQKLSGQVLRRETGTLANSIVAVPAQVVGTTVTGEVLGAGGPAWYGRVHNYGGTKAYDIRPVDKRALRMIINGKAVFSTHNIHPPAEKRNFMESSVEEMRYEIVNGIAEAILGVIR